MKIKNIHIITSLESGGAQKVLYDFLSYSKNNKNSIVYCLRGKAFYDDKLASIGIRVKHLNKISNIFSFFYDLYSSKGYVKSWMYHSCILSLFSKLNFKRNIFWSIHHGCIDKKTDSFSTILAANLAALLSYIIPKNVIFVSQHCMNTHINYGFNPKNAIFIYNHITLPKLNVEQLNKNLVTFVGREHPNKNLDLFLEMSKKIDLSIYNMQYCIVGKNTDKRNTDFNNQNYLFYGEVDKETLDNIYQKTKVYISTSHVESFGLTLIEALSHGCDIICPEQPVFKEVAENWAYYYTPNDINALTDSLNKLLLSRQNKKDNIKLKNFLKRYSFEETTKKLIELVEK
ncbi:glycosyltransferase [Proteus mirabilis]|uniref:glycosyltransferase n=1 Tax=Proteus mirabilis TaxID=584 RepID=UPI0013D34110|nr:glycosyltransferase [Proteus mirabilis]MBI6260273.1 glycosyltransferase [Proteus mirabilis]HEK1816848.1 glycosyltransferase [Proteus mirabilis]HEK2144207.1 glycosyltransferase [Proteus mirabilis]HEK2856933.1 glycosyltransferase [Proteus mirabilis]HEK3218527.1 glycosyltransferase [Proteus mirabilis]